MHKDIVKKLKDNNHKLTPQRLEIIEILLANEKSHPSLNNIHKIVKSRLKTVSFSTLYNTISMLEKIGILRVFDLKGETRIEMNNTNHINLIDKQSNNIYDIDDSKLIKDISKSVNFDKKKHKSMLVNVIIE